MAGLRSLRTFLNGAIAAVSLLLIPIIGHPARAESSLDLPATMQQTVRSMLHSQLESGLFPYGFDFETGKELESGEISSSNLIRQAGTASSLADYLLTHPNPAVASSVQKALSFFVARSLPIESPAIYAWLNGSRVLSLPFGQRTLQRALNAAGWLYRPAGPGIVISPDATYKRATTGILSLVLLTEIRYAQATGDQTFAGQREGWLSALRDLRIDGVGFRGNPESLEGSDYYNGEAWFALATYARLHPNASELEPFLTKLDDDLMKRYAGYHSRGFYHWGALAAAERYAATRNPKFLKYLKQQTDLYFDHLGQYGRNANLCSEMEGLSATLTTLKNAGEGGTHRASEIREWLLGETQKLKSLQIQPGQIALLREDGTVLHSPQLREYVGHFRWGLFRPEFRIDASQHCLSAMLLMQRGVSLQVSM